MRPHSAWFSRDGGRAGSREEASPAAVYAPRWVSRLVAFLIGGSLLGVIGLAFMVSFEAIQSFAGSSGAVRPSLRWAIPPLVDLPILIASLVILVRSLVGARATLAVMVLALAAGASLALNMAHAPRGIGAVAVSLIAPAALVVSIELAMSELRRVVRAWHRSPGPPGDQNEAATMGERDAGSADLGPTLPIVTAIYRTRELEGGESLSGPALSRALAEQGIEVSDRDARRLLAVLRPSGYGSETEPAQSNGQRPDSSATTGDPVAGNP